MQQWHFVPCDFPLALSGAFGKNHPTLTAWILIFPTVVSAHCDQMATLFLFFSFFTDRQPCWREQMFTWVSCEQERHTPTMYFSVSEGEASFAMQCYWRLELFFDNGLIFDAAFPCLLVEFVNGVKKKQGKMGGSVKTVNMLLSCRTALLCDWGGCSFDTAATWEVDACEPDSACWKHDTIPHRETPLRICYRYNISRQCRWMGE